MIIRFKLNNIFLIFLLVICLCFIININYAIDSNNTNLNYSINCDELVSVEGTEILSKSYSVNGGSFSDIREVINKASSGDTIRLSGKFSSDGKIIKVDKKLIFTSSNGVTFDGKSKSGIFLFKNKC